MSHLENAANNQLLYDTLISGLGRPEMTFSDAHYLTGTLSGGEAFKVDDYGAYILKGVPRILEQTDREQLLAVGRACLDVTITPAEPQGQLTYLVARPADIQPRLGVLEFFTDAGVDAESTDPHTYNFHERRLLPDPFTEPHLRALYDYLTTA